MKKRIAVIVLAAILVLALASGCSGERLSGTWQGYRYEGIEEEKYFLEFTFSGNSYTLRQYIEEKVTYSSEDVTEREESSFGWLCSEDDLENKELVRTTPLHKLQAYKREAELYEINSKGRYKLSDGKMKFIVSDGAEIVYGITRTEDAMVIDGRNFTLVTGD